MRASSTLLWVPLPDLQAPRLATIRELEKWLKFCSNIFEDGSFWTGLELGVVRVLSDDGLVMLMVQSYDRLGRGTIVSSVDFDVACGGCVLLKAYHWYSYISPI